MIVLWIGAAADYPIEHIINTKKKGTIDLDPLSTGYRHCCDTETCVIDEGPPLLAKTSRAIPKANVAIPK